MDKEQKSNLARTAIFMLNDHKLKFSMSSFCNYDVSPKGSVLCGTSCCLAGYGPHALGNVKQCESWAQYAQRAFTGETHTWSFLFSMGWSNDKLQAAARVLLCLQGKMPKEWYCGQLFKTISLDETIEELEKFVI